MDTRDAFRAYLRTGDPTELRAAGEATGSAGGYLFPAYWLAELAVTLQQFGSVFRDFTDFSTTHGRPMTAPTANFASAGVVQAEDSGPVAANDRVYGQVSFGDAYTIASGMHQVSFQLEADSGFPIESVITAYAGESIGRKLSALSVNGSGSGQPTGVITAANTQGTAGTVGGAITATGGFITLSAARAVEVNGASTTELASQALSPQTLLAMVQGVDPAYYLPDAEGNGGAKWYMNVASYAAACQVTDTTGQPLIRPNGPRTLHGFPIVIANELPNLTASTLGGPVFGNLSKGMYLRNAGFEVRRLKERYADSAQAGYLGWLRCDSAARDARAFVTVKAAAT
jgi:HK97 family phage major capsid protein